MQTDARSLYEQHFGRPPRVVARAPGRVNLIGEHTDYNSGLVLPGGIDRHVEVACGEPGAPGFILHAPDLAETHRASGPPTTRGGGVADYVAGMITALLGGEEDAFRRSCPRGLGVLVTGTVPRASGLSSSAALLVATGLAVHRLLERSIRPLELARLCQRVENDFVGVRSGIMDPFASAHARKGSLLLLDCRDLTHQEIPFPSRKAEVLVLDTRVERRLGETGYNRRREECEEAVAALRTTLAPVTCLRDVDLEMLQKARPSLGEVLFRRASHVVTENRRVTETVRHLRAGDLEAVGRILRESHASLARDYEVSCPELDLVVETAGTCEGVLGARMTGAGFGGCALALARKGAGDDALPRIAHVFRERFSREGAFFRVELTGEPRVEEGSCAT
jgi:galactokinase